MCFQLLPAGCTLTALVRQDYAFGPFHVPSVTFYTTTTYSLRGAAPTAFALRDDA